MNVAQLLVAARNMLMAGSSNNTNIVNDPFWNDTQLLQLANQAQRKLWLIIRRAHKNYFTRTLRTTDSALTILGQTFTPSSLAWVSGTRSYTLPPDFMRMLSCTDLTASGDGDRLRLTFRDLRTEGMRALMNQSASSTPAGGFYADIVDKRTLLIRPIPASARDWEFIYERRLPPLRTRSTGTATIANGGTTVTFSATTLANRFMQVGDELIFSTSMSAPTADPSETYPVIESVDSATQVTLEGPYYTTDGSNLTAVGFIAARVSDIPDELHDALVFYMVKEAFKFGPNASLESSMLYQGMFDDQVQDIINDVETRQLNDGEEVSPYLGDEEAALY